MIDFLEDDRRLGDAETGAAEFLGDERRQIAGRGQGADELVRIGARGVEVALLAVREATAQVADGAAQIGVQVNRHKTSGAGYDNILRLRAPGGRPEANTGLKPVP